MTFDNSSLLMLAAPAAMLLASLAAFWRPGSSPVLVNRISVGAAAFSIYIAAIGVALLINHGPMYSAMSGWAGFGLSVQIEPLSMFALSMSSLAAFYFVRLSCRHMAGYCRQVAFLARLSATIASVQLLVLTDNLGLLVVAAVLAGLTVHGLLVFHRETSDASLPSTSARLDSPRRI